MFFRHVPQRQSVCTGICVVGLLLLRAELLSTASGGTNSTFSRRRSAASLCSSFRWREAALVLPLENGTSQRCLRADMLRGVLFLETLQDLSTLALCSQSCTAGTAGPMQRGGGRRPELSRPAVPEQTPVSARALQLPTRGQVASSLKV